MNPILSFLLPISLLIHPILTVSPIGINYGQVANNLPAPAAVIPLLRSINAGRVKLYDSDPRVLRSFAGTDIEFVIGLPDRSVPSVRSPSAALSWVTDNVKPYLPKTKIVAVTVGNEVLSSNNTLLIQSLIPAMNSIHSALASLGFDKQVAVTTAHSLSVLAASYPPSAGAFRKDLMPYISPLLSFLNKTGSPFLINAYPFFAYKADPKRVSLDYVLFEPNSGVLDPSSGLRYDNMLHAQVDAVRSAIAAAGGGKGIEVRVSETGWPSQGDEDEVGATSENARKYNGNLMKLVADGKGTPMCPGSPLHVYVFALFNENMKPGPASERHYGLFNPDMSPAYDIGAKPVSGNSSNSSGGGGSDADSPSQSGRASSSTFYTISAAPVINWVKI